MKLSKIPGPLDRESLSGFDASYSTGRIYRITVNGLSVELREENLEAPLYRSHDLADVEESIAGSGQTVICEDGNKMIGFAALRFEKWNRRAILGGIYVRPEHKRQGVGTALLREAIGCAKEVGARCLWLETQNTNYPAINFYRKAGFKFCGFDNSLYDPGTVLRDEIALYFCLDTWK